jgi:hypothetical protein
MVTNPTREMVVTSVISQLLGAFTKLSAIIKIYKYKVLHEGHHFILMTMEMHDTFGCDMNHFIRECARLFHDRQS